MELYICGQCGNVSLCAAAGLLHQFTAHHGRDVRVDPRLTSPTGKDCFKCLMESTIPIKNYWDALDAQRKKGQ